YIGATSKTDSFADDLNSNRIQRVYVINLDRQPNRWRRMTRELAALKDRSGRPLTTIARRFSAIDARYRDGKPDRYLLQTDYSLADQLFVQPSPLIASDLDAHARRIEMTPQEVAVALSHIEVWNLVSNGDRDYTLV